MKWFTLSDFFFQNHFITHIGYNTFLGPWVSGLDLHVLTDIEYSSMFLLFSSNNARVSDVPIILPLLYIAKSIILSNSKGFAIN